MTMFVALLLPILLGLGAWQLQRGKEKAQLHEAYLASAGALPVNVGPAGQEATTLAAFDRVRLLGRYLPGQYYLIDNQVREGQVGYAVIHRFEQRDGPIWLLRRGFVAGLADRSELPAVAAPAQPVTVVAMVWPDTGLVPLLAPDSDESAWPRVRQRVDTAAMAAADPGTLALELRLEPGSPGLLAPPTLLFPSGAERHQGYAVQWFALAMVLIAGFVIYGVRGASQQRAQAGSSQKRADAS